MPNIIPDALALPVLPTDEVIIHRGTRSFVSPATFALPATGTIARYVGPVAGNPTVTVDNFRFRFETATTNLQIATVAGTETVKFFAEGFFGAMAAIPGPHNNNAFAVSTTFTTIGDPGAVFIAEHRSIVFTPTNTADLRAYEFEYAGWDDGANDKILLRLKAW
jgi:hypothetical protein